LFVLGEGADGFGPKTIAAAQKLWNESHPFTPMTDEWLDEHLHLVERMPHLLHPLDVTAIAAVHKKWNPDLVFFDTLGTALAGEDLNSGQTGTASGDAMTKLAQTLKADCFYIHHKNKTGGEPAGTQYFLNNPNSV